VLEYLLLIGKLLKVYPKELSLDLIYNKRGGKLVLKNNKKLKFLLKINNEAFFVAIIIA
jgi:hypothetical protein